MIPNDPFILFSYINTKLRDNYKTLEALCDDLELDEAELCQKIASIGYNYNAQQNKFV